MPFLPLPQKQAYLRDVHQLQVFQEGALLYVHVNANKTIC